MTLNDEEALVVTHVARRHAAALRRLAPDLPPEQVVRDAAGVARTALKPRAFRALVADYPTHFPETACAFLGPTAHCALQDLAVERGEAPWTYKPLACWLHPIVLSAEEIRLPDAATDPYPGGFASRTPCGRSPACGGATAHEVLAPELAHLGRWLGRDLRDELAAAVPEAAQGGEDVGGRAPRRAAAAPGGAVNQVTASRATAAGTVCGPSNSR